MTNEEYRAGQRGQETLDRENEVLIQKGQKPKRTKFETEKEKIRQAIQKAVAVSHSPEEFQKILQEQYGIQVKESRGRWSYLPQGRLKPITGRKLGDDFEKEAILEAIQRERIVIETEGSLLGAQKENMLTFVHSGQKLATEIKANSTIENQIEKSDLREVLNLGQVINLDENEDLIGVELTDGNSEIILATRNGIAIRFDEQDVRSMGRTAHGVRGISLNYGDEVVAMDSVPNENYEVLTATEFGMGKRTAVSEYRKQTRGGKGIINIKITERTGLVVGMKVINPAQEIMMITSGGIIIRIDVDSISQYGRVAQGVKLMTLNENDRVVSLAAIHHEE